MSSGLAPLCFGAVTFFSQDGDRCLSCASFDRCSVAVQKNIKEISRIIDCDSLMAQHRSAKSKAAVRAAKVAIDSGKLKTQAPAVELNVERGTVVLKSGPSVEIRSIADSVLRPLLGSGSLAQLRTELTNGRNPFSVTQKEQWILCELLRRGASTRAGLERAMTRVGASEPRMKAVVTTLLHAKIVVAGEGDNLLLNPI